MAASEDQVCSPGLWHACAGPLVTLPSVGSPVVYFPQGHLEQVAASLPSVSQIETPTYPSLAPHVLCRLVDVSLHADQETDFVFAQMTLLPIKEEEVNNVFFDRQTWHQQTAHPSSTSVFCKTLSTSDTSTNGGFSVPKKAAENCLPPLDYEQDPPMQTVVAKDLHGFSWNFRHIFRGHPKRHLLTTGWMNFISAKKIKSGDTVLFLREDSGELSIGCRRSHHCNTKNQSSLLSLESIQLGVLATAAQSIANNAPFTVSYNPRTSQSPFVIPYYQFLSALRSSPCYPGLGFRMECETEEFSCRRFRGTVAAVRSADRGSWPNSLWKTLEVRWDEAVAGNRRRFVSVWEIEMIGQQNAMTAPSIPRPQLAGRQAKKLRMSNLDTAILPPERCHLDSGGITVGGRHPGDIPETESESNLSHLTATPRPSGLGLSPSTANSAEDNLQADQLSGGANDGANPHPFNPKPLNGANSNMGIQNQHYTPSRSRIQALNPQGWVYEHGGSRAANVKVEPVMDSQNMAGMVESMLATTEFNRTVLCHLDPMSRHVLLQLVQARVTASLNTVAAQNFIQTMVLMFGQQQQVHVADVPMYGYPSSMQQAYKGPVTGSTKVLEPSLGSEGAMGPNGSFTPNLNLSLATFDHRQQEQIEVHSGWQMAPQMRTNGFSPHQWSQVEVKGNVHAASTSCQHEVIVQENGMVGAEAVMARGGQEATAPLEGQSTELVLYEQRGQPE